MKFSAIALVFTCFPSVTATVQVILNATQDTFIRGGTFEDTNYGSYTSLTVKDEDRLLTTRVSFIQFNLPSENVLEASLELLLQSHNNSEYFNITASTFAPNINWSETDITWANDDLEFTKKGESVQGGDDDLGKIITWNVTSLVTAHQQVYGASLITFGLDCPYFSTSITTFSSKEGSMPPKLKLTQPDPPPTPSPTSAPSPPPTENPTAQPSFTPPQLLSWYIDRISNGTIIDTNSTAEMRVYYNMTHRNYSFTVLDPTCNETKPATGISVLPTTFNSSQPDGFINVMTDILFNATEIESNDNVWSGNSTAGVINFCLIANLWSSNNMDTLTGNKITFDETVFRIKVDKTSTFKLDNIDIDRASAESVEGPDIDYEAEIDAYQCDETLTKIDSPVPLSQKNNILSICVYSNSTIQVSSIVSLTLSQEARSSFPPYIYRAVDNGTPENIALVAQSRPVINGVGKKVARVQVVLDALLFANPVPAPVDVSGTVALDVAGLPSGRKRNLSLKLASLFSPDSGKMGKKEGRLLQDNDSTTDFSLSADLVGNDSAGGISTTPGTFSTMAGGAVLAGVLFA